MDEIYIFILVVFLILVIVFLFVYLFLSKKDKKKNVVDEKVVYKIESNEPIYKEVHADTNEVINNPGISEDVWNEENNSIEQKDILIVPEVEEVGELEVSPIGIKEIPNVDTEVKVVPTETMVDGMIKFNSLVPELEESKPIKHEAKPLPSKRPEIEEKNCPHCGAKVRIDATTCFMCGKTF